MTQIFAADEGRRILDEGVPVRKNLIFNPLKMFYSEKFANFAVAS